MAMWHALFPVVLAQLPLRFHQKRHIADQYNIPKRARWAKMATWSKGKPKSKEHRAKLSRIAQQRTGEKSPRYGAKLSKATRQKISNSLKGRFRGPLNPQWTGGRRYERSQWMARYEYKEWRTAIFARDDYTCQACNKPSNGDIEAHHIHPWRDFPDLRFSVTNGITLCKDCHQLTKGKETDFIFQFIAIVQSK